VHEDELYRGTAEYYARFRPRYPAVVLEAISHLDQYGAPLLDLACGTGEVSLALADRVAEIWAIDVEPEMVAIAQRYALDRGVGRIRWLVGRAEDCVLPEGHFGLIAAGRAFHRLNRPLIAVHSLRWLRRGGSFVDLGADSAGLFEPSEPWLAAAAEVYERWLPRARKSRADVTSNAPPAQPSSTTEAVLTDAGFTQVAKHEFAVPYVWEIDQFAGYLCSTSYSSRAFWGDAWTGFERDLRETLASLATDGVLRETISAYVVIGCKP